MKKLKSAINISNQIVELESKGIIVDNKEYATQILNRINYYRILGYILPFKQNLKNGEKIHFRRIMRVLAFDQRLRGLLLKYIEHVEISLRTFIVKSLAFKEHKDGISYRNPCFYRSKEKFEKWIASIDEAAAQSDEPFMVHYRREYNGQYPIWVILEVVSIGKLSRMYEILNKNIQRDIAGCYNNIHHSRLIGYLKAVSYLRNKCAHHSRIYYRMFKAQVPAFWYGEKGLENEYFTNKRLFSQLYILKDLCVDVNTWGTFLTDLTKLVKNFEKDIDIRHLGFPEDWQKLLKQ